MKFKKYIDSPKDKWPDFKIKWNLDLDKSLKDNIPRYDSTDFLLNYYFPKGALVGWVNLNDLFDHMTSFCKKMRDRDSYIEEELNNIKIAKIISSCINKKELLPPYIDIVGDSFGIRNGWHRLLICLAKKEKKIPIFISHEKKMLFEKKIKNIEWV